MAGNSRPAIGHPAAGDAPAGGRANGVVITIHAPADPLGGVHRPPPLEPPMRVAISQAEQDHHAELRRRSYELAVARGHINRWPA